MTSGVSASTSRAILDFEPREGLRRRVHLPVAAKQLQHQRRIGRRRRGKGDHAALEAMCGAVQGRPVLCLHRLPHDVHHLVGVGQEEAGDLRQQLAVSVDPVERFLEVEHLIRRRRRGVVCSIDGFVFSDIVSRST